MGLYIALNEFLLTDGGPRYALFSFTYYFSLGPHGGRIYV